MNNNYRFVVCVDPETAKYYSFNLENYEIHIQQFSSADQERLFEAKATRAIRELREIISWQQYNHRQTPQVWEFRRRMLPEYLLQEVKLKLPSYIDESSLPQSLAEDVLEDDKGNQIKHYRSQIEFVINLQQYSDQIRRQELYHSNPSLKIPTEFGCTVKLVTSVKEVLKVILKCAFKQKQIEISPMDPNKKLVLKVMGSEDYLYGNTPVMNYVYVRKCLRARQSVKLVLCERKIQEDSTFCKAVFFRDRMEVNRGIYSQVDWKKLQQYEVLLWYPPVPLTEDTVKKIKLRQAYRRQYSLEYLDYISTKKKNPLYQSIKLENIQTKLRLLPVFSSYSRPRFMLKQSAIANVESRRSDLTKRIITLNPSKILSGQCFYPFKIKLISVDEVLRIFQHHVNYKPQNINLEKSSTFTTHFEYNSSVFSLIKKSGILTFTPHYLCVKVQFTYGDLVLHNTVSVPMPLACSTAFEQSFEWISLSKIPLESKIYFVLRVLDRQRNEGMDIGFACLPIFDDKGFLNSGLKQIVVWPMKSPDLRISGCIGNYTEIAVHSFPLTSVSIELPKFNHPVEWSLQDNECLKQLYHRDYNPLQNTSLSTSTEDLSKLDQLLRTHPLEMMKYTEKDKIILQACKKHYSKMPDKFVNFVYSVDWTDPRQVAQAIRSREQWEPLNPKQALALLSCRTVDQAIRFYAVERMIKMPDGEVVLLILQLVQCLAVECNHHSPLAELLLERAVLSPYSVGHALFWQLRSQLYKSFEFERYALVLQSYVLLSKIRRQFIDQIKVNMVLVNASEMISNMKSKVQQRNVYFKNTLLPQFPGMMPKPFVLALNPQKKNDGFLEGQCKVFDSKKVPFLLTLTQKPRNKHQRKNPLQRSRTATKSQPPDSPSDQSLVGIDGSTVVQRVIFKRGDDLRQDQLTLQVLKIMDNIWLNEGYDFKMNIYRVLSVDNMVGYIECVDNAENSSNIHVTQGGRIGALADDTFERYIRQHNPGRDDYKLAKDNFLKSNVAYLVASYILGLGDRHSGNVMITKNGMFFHIDFGHFLGNFKEKFNIKREISPFLFTTQFAYVMGGTDSQQFKKFVQLCGIAYNLVRKNAYLIIHLFSLMTAAGIPELYQYDNIKYMVDKLALHLSPQEAAAEIKKAIEQTLEEERMRRYDNVIHEFARKG